MRKEPPISVLMSVYNGERYLSASIESILNQTFSDFEFIIVNDGSTDRTPQILAEYERKDSRIRIFHQSNLGLTASLNNAIGHAKGKYIARMDCGDISMPTRIEKQLKYITDNELIGLVGTYFSYMNDNDLITYTVERSTENGLLKWLLLFYNPIPNALAMFRLDVARKIGYYDSRYPYSQDYDFLCRISEETEIAIVPEVLFLVRGAQGEDISSKHLSAQKKLSLQTSHRRMEKLTNKQLPSEIVRILKYEKIPSAEQAISCAKLLIDLYRQFLSCNTLNQREIGLIKKDSARRLWNISRPNLKCFPMWLALFYACCLDIYYAKALLAAPMKRIAFVPKQPV